MEIEDTDNIFIKEEIYQRIKKKLNKDNDYFSLEELYMLYEKAVG